MLSSKGDDADAGPRRSPPAPERLCAATRTITPTAEMIRFVVAPDGGVVADLKRTLPGRGVWVTARRWALAEATKRQIFCRDFRQEVRVEPNFLEQVEGLLEREGLNALAIAGKAGRVATGFGKVEAALHSASVRALVQAAEARDDGVRKLAAAARRALGPGAERLAVITLFSSAQLDLALGRANVIHAALLTGRESESVLSRCAALERFRDDGGPPRRP
jgi:predicted RNA-binding protein YlxR (DUF448 family)